MLDALTAYSAAIPETVQMLSIKVDGQEQLLELVTKLRALPNRRAVFKARWKDKWVLAKIFLGKHSERDASREKNGINALQQASITTAALLAEGVTVDVKGRVLLIEFLDNAQLLEDAWSNALEQSEKQHMLEQVITTIAKQHQAGLQQADIHLDNFLIKEGNVYTLDGGGIDTHYQGSGLSVGSRINNVALFFAQWPLDFDVWIKQALIFYYQATRIDLPLPNVVNKVKQCRQVRWQQYRKKIYRQCSEFVCEHTADRFMICRREYMTPAFAKWLTTVEADLHALSKSDKIKNGITAVVGRLECDGHTLIVKRYNIKNMWHALSRFFRPSRAWDAWHNGYLLRFWGITTPLPVALIEKRIGPLRGVAFLITEAVSGLPLHRAIAQGVDCIDATSEQIKKLAMANIIHGDMKSSNFLVSDKKVYLIDLDTMKQHHSSRYFKKAFSADMVRFMRNWEQQPDVQKAFEVRLKNVM